MTDEIDDDEPYGTYAPRRPKRVLHSQVVEFKMSGESVESVAERYDRIRRELRETVKKDEAALMRRLAKARERRRAEAKAVTSRSWWIRLQDWWRGRES